MSRTTLHLYLLGLFCVLLLIAVVFAEMLQPILEAILLHKCLLRFGSLQFKLPTHVSFDKSMLWLFIQNLQNTLKIQEAFNRLKAKEEMQETNAELP